MSGADELGLEPNALDGGGGDEDVDAFEGTGRVGGGDVERSDDYALLGQLTVGLLVLGLLRRVLAAYEYVQSARRRTGRQSTVTDWTEGCARSSRIIL
jgi:hypothetical protein